MQVTLFKGLLPLNLPDVWFEAHPERIRFGRLDGDKQCIDFRPVGGCALSFWVVHTPGGGRVRQCHQELPDHIADGEVEWGTTPAHLFAVCSRQEVALFGQSSQVLDLMHLA